MIQKIPYLISANGVYRCCKYLLGITFYDEENGWTEESEEIGSYSYKKILHYLRNNYSFEYGSYNGDVLWNDFFMADRFLKQRIEYKGIASISQLHYYAVEAANRR